MTQSSPTRDQELIILGGGCAGLSLAARLVQQKPDLALTIIEPRTHYQEDRTWCGWRIAPHFFSDCVVGQSDAWRIVTPAGAQQLTCSAYPYEIIRAGLFYEKAARLIHDSPSATLLAGAAAERVSETKDHAQVELADGRTLCSPWVVDTRPQARVLIKPWLWQNFVGYEIELNGATQFLDGMPTLMEFQDPGESVAQFMYTIPFGDGRILCECTRFSAEHGQAQALEAELRRWLDQRFGYDWTAVRKEMGALPMAPPFPNAHRRIVPAGTRGGSMRISTGYAFHRIQRWADACAQSIMRNGVPTAPPDNRILDGMDELFLRVLQEPSHAAAELFGDLFRSCPADRLVRFLSGVPRTLDLWHVARGLPWGKFLRQTPKLAESWLTGAERTA